MPTFEERQSLPDVLNSILIAGIVFNQTPGIILLDTFPDTASVPPTTVVNFAATTPTQTLTVSGAIELTGHIILLGDDLRVCNRIDYDGLPPLIPNVAGGVLLAGGLDLTPGTTETAVTSIVQNTFPIPWVRVFFEAPLNFVNPGAASFIDHFNGVSWVPVASAVKGPGGSLHCTGLGIDLSLRLRWTGPTFLITNVWGYTVPNFDLPMPFP